MQVYLESRSLPATPTATLAADIARHLQTRQYLGTAVVVCENPVGTLSATRKQWLRLGRQLQRMRASTLNAEEILRFTRAIMHMQNMQFAARTPDQDVTAAVYFVEPAELTCLPRNCYSLYIAAPFGETQLCDLVNQMPATALIIDYDNSAEIENLNLNPKTTLEKQVLHEWQHITTFLRSQQIEPNNLINGTMLNVAAMDDALDTVLTVSSEFLREAAAFQHALHVAQPLQTISINEQRIFEAVTRLAHRAQALTPDAFSHYLIHTFGDKEAETYFLRDVGAELSEDDDLNSEEVLIAP